MDRRTLAFIALAVSMLYGVGFTVTHSSGYATFGGVAVATLWIAVGVFGRDNDRDSR